MSPTPEEIENSLIIPHDIADPMFAEEKQQDKERGEWLSQRHEGQPNPPWPDENSMILRYLMHKFQASVDAGMDVRTAALQLAVHAWRESGIENYDRGQRDARSR